MGVGLHRLELLQERCIDWVDRWAQHNWLAVCMLQLPGLRPQLHTGRNCRKDRRTL
jgi:hypothetical protein